MISEVNPKVMPAIGAHQEDIIIGPGKAVKGSQTSSSIPITSSFNSSSHLFHHSKEQREREREREGERERDKLFKGKS